MNYTNTTVSTIIGYNYSFIIASINTQCNVIDEFSSDPGITGLAVKSLVNNTRIGYDKKIGMAYIANYLLK